MNQQKLKYLLSYNPDTGIFTWLQKPCKRVNIGDVAGCDAGNGYNRIRINNKVYSSHRLAFLYMIGRFPDIDVDHINRNPSDNRWINLRECTVIDNHRNRKDNNDFIGVCFDKGSQKWMARAPRSIYIGLFKTYFAACYARHAYDSGEF